MSKFKIDERYRLIQLSYNHWDQIDEIQEWCYNTDNGEFAFCAMGIVYKTERDLTAFLLKWQ